MQQVLPRQAQRVPDETAAMVVRQHVRGWPDTRIAKELGISRTTVRRVRERVLAAMAVLKPIEEERAKAIILYREVQRVAWEAVEATIARGRSPVMLLGEIRQCQARIDSVLGLAAVKPEVLEVHTFQHIVASLIREEAPELADKLAGRLLELRNGDAG